MRHTAYFVSQKRDGFLLIEMMISIVLISIIISFGMLSVGYLHKVLVRADVEKLYSICSHLQRVAMSTNQRQVISFDTVRNCYSYNGHEEKLSFYSIFGVLNNIKGPPSEPKNVISNPITFIGQRITFTPNGILQPGTIYITDKNKRYQFALTIPVSQISFLRKYRYDGAWHYIP